MDVVSKYGQLHHPLGGQRVWSLVWPVGVVSGVVVSGSNQWIWSSGVITGVWSVTVQSIWASLGVVS